MMVPARIEGFVDPKDVFHEFPLWAKIWEASVVLADHMAAMPVEPDSRFLEIGGGLGLVGIVGAFFGHEITLTEYSKDALDFARANARSNLDGMPQNLHIEELDWHEPRLEGTFDHIIGSEVVYKENDFDTLLALFRRYLAPSGTVILAEGVRKTSMEFFSRMEEFFHIRGRKKTLRSDKEAFHVILCTMRWKEGA